MENHRDVGKIATAGQISLLVQEIVQNIYEAGAPRRSNSE